MCLNEIFARNSDQFFVRFQLQDILRHSMLCRRYLFSFLVNKP